MTKRANEELLRRYISEVWEANDPDALPRFLHPDYRRHVSANATIDLAGQVQRLAAFRAAFPDVTLIVEDVIPGNDRVAFRSTMRGTHRGEFLGVTPTGRRVTVGLIDVIRIEDGRFIEQWGGPDLFDLLVQLGASPDR